MIIALLSILPISMVLLILWGIHRRWPTVDQQPPVTVVICARDEEPTIFSTLMSLATQDYPEDLYKLILVDHLSRDRTGELMELFAQESPVKTRVLHIREEDPQLKGKVHALYEGLELVDTEIVMLTDGDCIVPHTWISTMVKYFRDDVAAVNGQVTVGRDGVPDSPIAHLQHVDHRYYLGMLTGLAGLRAPGRGKRAKRDLIPRAIRRLITPLRPAFAIGNNLAFRMSAYYAVGGYREIGPTLIEDFALMNAIVSRTRRHLAVIQDSGARVWTTPEPSLKGLWHQKRRWASAMNHFNPLSTLLFFGIFILRILLPWLVWWHPLYAGIPLLVMAALDTVVIQVVSHRTGDRIRLRDCLLQELYQIVLNHLLLVAALFRWPVVWKGQRYR